MTEDNTFRELQRISWPEMRARYFSMLFERPPAHLTKKQGDELFHIFDGTGWTFDELIKKEYPPFRGGVEQ